MPKQALDASAELPDGPYSVGLTKGPGNYTGPPWTVVCGDGRAIAGHVPSKAIAEGIAAAMNYFTDATMRMYIQAWVEGRVLEPEKPFKGESLLGPVKNGVTL